MMNTFRRKGKGGERKEMKVPEKETRKGRENEEEQGEKREREIKEGVLWLGGVCTDWPSHWCLSLKDHCS